MEIGIGTFQGPDSQQLLHHIQNGERDRQSGNQKFLLRQRDVEIDHPSDNHHRHLLRLLRLVSDTPHLHSLLMILLT